MIDFYGQFDRIVPKHLEKMNAAMQLALTEAGRAKLDRATEREMRRLGDRRQRTHAKIFANQPAIFDAASRQVAAAVERRARRTSEPRGGIA